MKENNIDIFVVTHKGFYLPVENDIYKIITVGDRNINGINHFKDNDSLNNISHLNCFFSELTAIYYIWKNYDIKEWIGFCHYRRFFEFLDNVPDLNKLGVDVVLPQHFEFEHSIYAQYDICSNKEDLDLIIEILEHLFDVLKMDKNLIYEFFHKNNKLYACNMFIIKRELFNEYCEFIFHVLFEYLRIKNLRNSEDIKQMVQNNSEKYLKGKYPMNAVEYQTRIGGAISERLFSFFIFLKNVKHIEFDFYLTEEKYKEKKETDFLPF
jgi:hypothetical protein